MDCQLSETALCFAAGVESAWAASPALVEGDISVIYALAAVLKPARGISPRLDGVAVKALAADRR